MTQGWPDIKNADVVLLMGSNAAENHPMAFKYIQEAKANGGKLINVDPRFCRSSSQADIHAYMRSGTDIAFLGGMIKYAIDHGLYNDKYVRECTNALLKVRTDFQTCAEGTIGVFSGFTAGTYDTNLQATLDSTYSKTTWEYDYGDQAWQASYSFVLGDIVRPTTATNYHYECTVAGTSGATEPTWPTVKDNTVVDGIVTWKCIFKKPKVAANLTDPDCVFQKLKKQFDDYTIARVCGITGTDPDVYEEICETFCGTYPDTMSATILYAMGITQHTVGSQNIRAFTILQLLLGNIGVAGGGINALRGQDNVQGSTDQAVLNHILPGYLKVPTPAQSTLALYNAANYNVAQTIQPVVSYTVRGAAKNPPSLHWWQNGTKYIASMLKAWWPAIDHNTSYTYLSRKTADYSILTMFDEMHKDHITGAIFDGENPAVSDPDSNHVREALGHLEWLVCIDPFEQETATFWKRPGVVPSTINTTVYLLPAAVGIEKYGSRSNSGRWQVWHWKGGNPPGQARADMDILTQLGDELKNGTINAANKINEPQIQNLSWPCLNYAGQTDDALAELIAKEMHGYVIDPVTGVTGALVSNFVGLQNNGTTACGNWLSSGSFVDPGTALDSFEGNALYTNLIWPAGGARNRMKRRYSPDVGQLGWGVVAGVGDYKKIGLYSYWAWCWPINRRIVYNRAATYQNDGGSSGAGLAGDPLAPNKYVMKWVPTNPPPADQLVGSWKGDQWDGGAAPASAMPYIMNKEGYGHHFGGWTMAEGPFPWHYEPAESPIPYPSWLGSYRMNPMVHNYSSSYAPHNGGNDTNYPIYATTYRLTEHYHTGTMTRNSPRLIELQPEPFVEMSEELADDLGIANGELVSVSSARGSIDLKACVTKRFKPFQLDAKTVHQVGIIWHWGYMGLSTGPSGNILTPFIGDANTRIQESKAFRVKIEKVVP